MKNLPFQRPANIRGRTCSIIANALMAAGICVAATGTSVADESSRDMRYFDEVPTVSQIADQLFPVMSRSIVIKKPARQAPAERSVAMPVLFHYGKTTLIEASKPYLDSVGKLMVNPEFERETLIIEGHTDSVGSDGFNQHLSELRALAVKDYLVSEFGIDPLRLFPAGKGERQLYDRKNPKSGKNRRVEFLRYSVKS